MKERTTKISLGILIIFAILFFFFMVSKTVPLAILSTRVGCAVNQEDREEILEGTGFIIAGKFEVNESNAESDGEITIDIPEEFPDERKKTIKHEQCHQFQFNKERQFNCEYGGIFRFINEMECYIVDDLPDGIYEKIYGKIKP